MRTQHQLAILLVALFAFSVSGSSLFNLRHKKIQPEATITIPQLQAIQLSDKELLKANICVDNIEVSVPAKCRTFERDCRDCWTEPYLSKCVQHCGAGNNCTCTGGSDCEKKKTQCENCDKTWKECQCPTGLELQTTEGWVKKCVLEKCPKGSWRARDSKCTDCEKCDEKCEECQYEKDNCQKCKKDHCLKGNKCVHRNTTCENGLHKVWTSDPCFDCRDKCPDDTYPDENNVCGPCKSPKFVHNNQCIDQCPEKSYESVDSTGKKICVKECPKKQWESEGPPRKCQPCNEECATCDQAADKCTSCKQPRFLIKEKCPERCQNGTYKHVDANGNIDCVTDCPSNQWEDKVSGECKPCDGNCKTCDKAAKECTTCKPDEILYQKKCYKQCPSPTFEQVDDSGKRTCVKDCSNDQYENEADRKCHPCDSSCKKCETKADRCITCPAGKIIHEHKCIDVCPKGWVVVGKDNVVGCQADEKGCVCKQCSNNCDECIWDESELLQCKVCKDGFYEKEGHCVQDCGSQFYPDTDKKKCLCCNDRCANCVGPGVDKCTACISPYQLRAGSCLKVGSSTTTTTTKAVTTNVVTNKASGNATTTNKNTTKTSSGMEFAY